MIGIIDYGMGNIHSVQKALQFYGARTLVTYKPEDIVSCDKIVLPGVGAFDDAMLELKNQGLINALREYIQKKKIFLGICLGLQLLFEESQEASKSGGLGILKGKVLRFAPSTRSSTLLAIPSNNPERQSRDFIHSGSSRAESRDESRVGIKVPHMGWNQLKIVSPKCPLLQDISDGAYVYFCHSYYPFPQDKEVVAATCNYGIDFTAVIWQDNIYGVQFHPEKSQETGLKILKNFVSL